MPKMNHGLTRFDLFMEACLDGQALNTTGIDKVLPQFFGRLADANPIHWSGTGEDLVSVFERLVDNMLDDNTVEGPADAGMTFFGQFVDHDITLDATSAIGSAIDPSGIRNIRTPNLDLDCVYGDGPEASPHLYTNVDGHEGFLLFGNKASPLDLARNCKGTALIGDPRNDENIFISQIQGMFICAHNLLLNEVIQKTELGQAVIAKAIEGTKAVTWSKKVPAPMNDFQIVRRFIRLHYQWIVMNDFLPQMVVPEIVENCIVDDPFGPHAALMPVEFSGAVYRFGHATVQEEYRLKTGEPKQSIFAKKGFEPRYAKDDIGMTAFFGPKAQKARPISTKVAKSLFELPFIQHGLTMQDGTVVTVEQAKKLPLRNLLRDRFTLEIASGQQVARMLGLKILDVPSELAEAHIAKTPLWFYALQEAEAAGGKLDGVGGAIVASILARLLKMDTTSYLKIDGFEPLKEFSTLAGLAEFVEAKRDSLPQRSDLWCPVTQ